MDWTRALKSLRKCLISRNKRNQSIAVTQLKSSWVLISCLSESEGFIDKHREKNQQQLSVAYLLVVSATRYQEIFYVARYKAKVGRPLLFSKCATTLCQVGNNFPARNPREKQFHYGETFPVDVTT